MEQGVVVFLAILCIALSPFVALAGVGIWLDLRDEFQRRKNRNPTTRPAAPHGKRTPPSTGPSASQPRRNHET